MTTETTMQPNSQNLDLTDPRVRAARIISDLISPPLAFAVLGFTLSWAALPFWQGLLWGAVYGFFISLVPILVVIYMYKTGQVQDLHMSNTHQRRIPYIVAIIGALINFILIRQFGGPMILASLALCNIIGLTTLGIINNFWLISNHVASITVAALFLGIVFGPVIGSLGFLLVALVFYARWVLRRHTLAQLFAGALVGLASVRVLFWLGWL